MRDILKNVNGIKRLVVVEDKGVTMLMVKKYPITNVKDAKMYGRIKAVLWSTILVTFKHIFV